jgi:hypothetical protein
MIVMENWGLRTVENELYQKRLKQTNSFSIKRVWAVIIAMTCAVEFFFGSQDEGSQEGIPCP